MGLTLGRSAVTLLCLWLATASAAAQSVSLVGAPAGNRYAAGPDFATDVLQDPWDFSNAADISPDPTSSAAGPRAGRRVPVGTAAAFLANGAFSATTLASGATAGDPKLSLLYRGGYDLVNPGRNGVTTPIPAATYRQVAIRVTYGAGARGTAALLWFGLPNGHPQDGSARGSAMLGVVAPAPRPTCSTCRPSGPGWAPCAGCPSTRPTSRPPSTWRWTGSAFTTADDDPAAARLTAAVVCGQAWTLSVQDAAGVPTAVRTGNGNASSVAVNYGIFPPGAYQLHLQCGAASFAGSSFTISAPPQVTVVAPGVGSGQDFATATLPAGAWDMAQAADVDALANVNPAASRLQAAPGGGTELYAESLGAPTPGAGDPVVSLLGTDEQRHPGRLRRLPLPDLHARRRRRLRRGLGSVGAPCSGPGPAAPTPRPTPPARTSRCGRAATPTPSTSARCRRPSTRWPAPPSKPSAWPATRRAR